MLHKRRERDPEVHRAALQVSAEFFQGSMKLRRSADDCCPLPLSPMQSRMRICLSPQDAMRKSCHIREPKQGGLCSHIQEQRRRRVRAALCTDRRCRALGSAAHFGGARYVLLRCTGGWRLRERSMQRGCDTTGQGGVGLGRTERRSTVCKGSLQVLGPQRPA